MSPAKVEKDQRRGTIVPVGGAEDKDGAAGILRRFLELAGGKKARVAIIPTASSLADTGRRYERLLERRCRYLRQSKCRFHLLPPGCIGVWPNHHVYVYQQRPGWPMSFGI